MQAGARSILAARRDLPRRDLHRSRARRARAPLHESRPAGVRAGQPAGDREGRAVRALLALPGHAAPPLPRRVRRRTRRPASARRFDGEEGERARKLYERIFLGYGDDSVAQLGGAHIACEWVSNVMTKVLQRGRLASYLEQSTRYIPYDGADAGRRLPLLARRVARARVRRGDGLPLRHLLGRAAARGGVGGGALPARRRRARGRARALDPGEGARPAARPAAGGLALAHGHLRQRPGLRAAAAAPVRLAAAGGARVRPHDPRAS